MSNFITTLIKILKKNVIYNTKIKNNYKYKYINHDNLVSVISIKLYNNLFSLNHADQLRFISLTLPKLLPTITALG